MDINLLGGDGEIGGNKVLVTHNNTKILLDFGMSFSRVGTYFCEFLKPRKCTSLKDFFEFDLLPEMSGIYREDYLRHMGKDTQERGVDALFLSHAHMDHAGYIHFLRKDIPIYCTKETRVILECMEETGRGSFSEFCTCCEAFTFYKNTRGGLSKVTRRNTDFVKERQYIVMEEGKPVDVGSFEVEMVPVDHSIPGACAFIMYSNNETAVYSGDLRFHGLNGEQSEAFVEKAKEAKPNYFICEGTRIDETKKDSEKSVEKRIKKLIQGKNLVFVEHPKRDIDRAKTIYDVAVDNNREFVVDLKLAFLLKSLGDMSPLNPKNVKILVPYKNWGLIDKEKELKDLIETECKDLDPAKKDKLPGDLIKQDYMTWERDYIFGDKTLTCEDLKKNPGNYIVSTSFWEISQLVDIKPEGNICIEHAIWIKSTCEPFSDEMELDEKRKKAWLDHFGIEQKEAHASGHASGPEIREMIQDINPGTVIPIHTEHPHMFYS